MTSRTAPHRGLSAGLGLIVLLAVLLGAGTVAAESPTEYIKAHTDEVTELLEEEASEERSEKFSKKAQELIDFRMLASRALEGYWEERSEEEQEEFLTRLQALLEANYKNKIEGQKLGEDYTIEYIDEKQREDRALVRMKVKWGETEKKQKPVDYKMMKQEDDWIVYDLVIDDISLEETYRESYTKIIDREGWDALIEKMGEKIEKLKEENGE